ncbi:MAG: hypothetical protein P1U36_02125 [Legionellaceae bacterium]|nr:hypothetical protein [Legionellaceae bacterium]
MGVLFFKHNEEEFMKNQEDKLNELNLLLQTYNLIAHDNQTGRSEGLQAVLDHLDTMVKTPTLRAWIDNDLAEYLNALNYYDDVTPPGP